jgi:hypothetical protein
MFERRDDEWKTRCKWPMNFALGRRSLLVSLAAAAVSDVWKKLQEFGHFGDLKSTPPLSNSPSTISSESTSIEAVLESTQLRSNNHVCYTLPHIWSCSLRSSGWSFKEGCFYCKHQLCPWQGHSPRSSMSVHITTVFICHVY